MSRPIFSIYSNDADKSRKAAVNLLPCRIHHDGPVGEAQTFWSPSKSDDGKHVAYFRGRKLHGTTVKLPEEYRGVVMQQSDQKVENRQPQFDDDAGDDAEEGDEHKQADIGVMKIQAEFGEMVIWGHETSADAASDPYVRSMEELLSLAEQIHSYPSPETKNGA